MGAVLMSGNNLSQSPTAAILAYCSASILMTVTNKFVLSSYEFHMNFMLLAIQSIVCILMLESFTKLQWVSHRVFRYEEAQKWFVVSLALVAMIYTGSKAMQYMPIPLFTIFKNLTIILIAYGEKTFFGGSKVSSLMLLSFTLMVFSSMIAGWADLSSGKASKDTADVGTFTTYFWMVMNCLTTAFYALVMRSKIKEVGFKDFDTVFYNNLLSIPVLVVASLLTEGVEFQRLATKYSNPDYAQEFQGLVFAIMISSVSTFAISYGSSWCVRVTSSTTYSMVGALNKLPIAIFGMMLFDDPVTVGGVLGVMIAFGAGIIYSYAKNKQSAEKAMALPTADIKMNPSEYRTPLARSHSPAVSEVRESLIHSRNTSERQD